MRRRGASLHTARGLQMLGAIAGDIIGSVHEFTCTRTKEFELFASNCFFTDDTVLTVALADSILTNTPYETNLRRFFRLYPDRGYGGSFHHWAMGRKKKPYGSWGNGAAMRISPAGFAYDDLDTVLRKAEEFTAVTHSHPEGIKGGQATAAAVFLARTGASRERIKSFIEDRFQYDLGAHVDEIRPSYGFDASCEGTVPQAIRAFIDSTGFEDAVRTAVSLGGDADTLACITGGIAQAFYGGVPEPISDRVYGILDERLGGITREFTARYCAPFGGRAEAMRDAETPPSEGAETREDEPSKRRDDWRCCCPRCGLTGTREDFGGDPGRGARCPGCGRKIPF